jgi:hypothetical protein
MKTRQFENLDIENLIEEIQDLGDSRASELESCLCVLFMHLLKWKYQQHLRSKSWISTIREHARRVQKRLKKTPSLKHRLLELAESAYEDARWDAHKETEIEESIFPLINPFNISEVLTTDWLEKWKTHQDNLL